MRGLLYILLFLFVTLSVAKADRCVNYVNDVRKAHYKVFGLDYPYWYGVGQLKQESGCRDIISRDGIGSQGLPQITYRWWSKFLTSKGIYDIKSVSNQTLAQAYIMQDAKKQAYSSHLWVAYQIYNGGSLVNKEISKARKDLDIIEVPHSIARKYCIRKDIIFNNGQRINACDINYEYPEKIYEYSQKYKIGNDLPYFFW